MNRPSGRTETCGQSQARTRLSQARAFLEVAELVGTEADDIATPSVTAALAVLAGIAASDSVCCAKIGRRSRAQDHRKAVALLSEVTPDGTVMARDLERLLSVKDDAHYGMLVVSGQRAAASLRQARRLVELAIAQVS